jgi:hypothetical protein
MMQRPDHAFPCAQAVRRLAPHPGVLGSQQLGAKSANDTCRDLVLDGEDVLKLPIVAFRPQVIATLRLE